MPILRVVKKQQKAMTLREAREQRGFSQEALAQKSGIEQTAISKLELGKTAEPLYSRGLALADALEIDPHHLRFGVWA